MFSFYIFIIGGGDLSMMYNARFISKTLRIISGMDFMN